MMTDKNQREEFMCKMLNGVRSRSQCQFLIMPGPKKMPCILIDEGKKFPISAMMVCVTYQGEQYKRTQDNLEYAILLGQRNILKEPDSYAFANAALEPIWTSLDADTSLYLAAFAANSKTPLALRAAFRSCPAGTIPEPKDGIVSITRDPRIITSWWQEVQERSVQRSKQEADPFQRAYIYSPPKRKYDEAKEEVKDNAATDNEIVL